MSNRQLASGNEAIARGAWEAGCHIACAYPGTPSTEILETIAEKYKDINAEWSVNEKVSLENAAGASITGARTLVAMKHVGLNVAADPLFSLSYMGLRGGMVIAVADDPGMHSSQNEQDSRHYARSAKIPMLQPADSEEARIFTKTAYSISEQFDTPVLLRTETRLSHSYSIINTEQREQKELPKEFERDPQKYVLIPAYARKRHVVIEDIMSKCREFAESFEYNTVEINDTSLGIITAGVTYNYVKEVLPNASILKLGMVWPLPKKKIDDFIKTVDKVLIVEQLDPFLETEIRAMGHNVEGKTITGLIGELSPTILSEKLPNTEKLTDPIQIKKEDIVPRPPILCPSCPHRGTFYVLKKMRTPIMGDIGCYTLSTLPPLTAMDSCLDMGAGVNMAFGVEKALGENRKKKIISVIGDSTFAHSGITGLLDIIYNKGNTLTVIVDNRITAMTGMQENPSSGYMINGEVSSILDFQKLAIAMGMPPENTATESPYKLKKFEEKVRELMDKDGPTLLVAKQPCELLKRNDRKRKQRVIIQDICTECGACLRIGCPAILKTEDGMKIDTYLCRGCSICAQVCNQNAIREAE